ncbi:MAG: transcriptional regulator [Roseburia sp.]
MNKNIRKEVGEMPYLTLKGEMAKKDITIEAVSQLLCIHRNSVANKLKGESSFSIEEATQIRDAFFPKMELEKLFQKEDFEEPDAEKTK